MEDVIKRWPGKPANPGSIPGRGRWVEICLMADGDLFDSGRRFAWMLLNQRS